MSWWVARAERTVSEEIPAPPNAVRDFYVDLDNIKRVHPLVVAVRATDRHFVVAPKRAELIGLFVFDVAFMLLLRLYLKLKGH